MDRTLSRVRWVAESDTEDKKTLPDAVFAALFNLFPWARASSDGGRKTGAYYAPNGKRERARRQTQVIRGQLKKENGLAAT